MTDPTRYEDEGEPTGRTIAIRTAGSMGDIGALAKAVEDLVRAQDRRDGATLVWRTLGGAAATIAIALGGWALALGQDAAVDHDRLGRVVVDVEGHADRLDAHAASIARIERDAAAQTATQVALARAVGDLTTEVRELRRELAERDRRR